MRALLLDDERIYLEVARSCLQALGVDDIQATTDTDIAIEILSEQQVDLILIDLNMPGQDGLAFLRQLSELDYCGAVIIVSGEKSTIVASARIIGEKLGLNMCGALSKPLNINDLKQCYELAMQALNDPNKVAARPKDKPKGVLTPVFYYQPQVDASGELVGAEALLRAIDQTGSVFGPNCLLSQVTSPDQCFALTARLFEIFCSDVSQMRRDGFSNRFAFNVDAANLEFPEFAQMLTETCVRHKVDTAGIVIELIESHLPNDETWLLEVIARLNMAGFEVAMDDFSTGASSFALLRAGAFSEIKLDVALVQESADDAASMRFIEGAIQIAKEMQLRLIAEGVETKQDLLRMTKLGVPYFQGFLIAKPASSNTLKQRYFADDVDLLQAS